MDFKLIVSTVKTDVTDSVVEAAKAAGATGATIVPGHGTGIHEAKTFLGLTLEAQTDAIMFLLEEHLVEPVLKAIHDAGRFEEPGTGIAFVVPIEQVVGLRSQIKSFEKRLRDEKIPVTEGEDEG
jgi:nitrogen regulatory protein PII